MDSVWLIDGGFNEIFVRSEKREGTAPSARKCALFQDRINGCNLVDLDLSGYKYT